MEKRFTPARQKSPSFDIPTGVGLTSSVTSASSDSFACLRTVSRTAAMVEGRARLGVPPPKNTDVMLRAKPDTDGLDRKLRTALDEWD